MRDEGGSDISTYTHQQLGELLEVWWRPGGVLSADQLRALIAWSGTPYSERDAMQTDLDSKEQQVRATHLKPNQRRGHNSFLDRVRGLFSR